MKKYLALLLVVLVVMLSFTGCNDNGKVADEAAAGWAEKTGDEVESASAEKYGNSMSENHQLMAIMILKGNDMESDLDQYDEVYLVKIQIKNGDERVMIVADGKNVYPKNIQ
jgi:outer membrane lipoprotein-sorting protein